MDFLHGNPEDFVNGQELPPLKRMRRSELTSFARAWGLQYPPNAKSRELLPLIEIAIGAEQIILGQTPPHPEFLLSTGDRIKKYGKPVASAVVIKEMRDAPSFAHGNPLTPKFRGPKHRWCVMNGEDVVQSGIINKEDAIAACG